jgi:23S rRNA (adenine2030-N6)-methyltransferase
LQDYLDVIAHFNPNGQAKIYPGSPFIIHHMMRHASRDRLKLFEMHPTDAKTLASNVAQLNAGRAIMIAREDGFDALKKLLPPPPSASGSRRAMVLIDPSYEIRSDYAKVASGVQDALKRFATGTYVVWYPIIARVEAHDLPKRLKTLANQANKPWLHASLSIGRHEDGSSGGLAASGMVVINPPYSLKDKLQEAINVIGPALARGTGHSFQLEHA